MRESKNHNQRIGIVLSQAPGYSETFFRSKITGLIDAGNQVVLFSSENAQNFDLCPVILLPKTHKNILKQLLGLICVYLGLLPHLKPVIRYVRLERKDNIGWVTILKRLYTHGPVFKQNLDWLHFGFGTLALGCENLAAANQAKLAVSFRGFDIGVYPIKHPNCYARLWDKVSKIHVISDDISDLVYKHGFKDQAPIIKITPAIDTHYFSTLKQSAFESPIQMVTVARLHWKKGLDYTLEALALLKQAGISFEYRIIGEGPEEEALKFACYQLGIEDEVFFLGKLNHADVKQQLEKSQVYIQFSVQEGFCNAVLEAQSMGLLCVVSDAEGLAENILDGHTGWVIPKRSPQLLAQKIKSVISLSEKQNQEIRVCAMSRIKEQFNIEKQQKEFIQFYNEY
ncbi:glycosyltransferase family 4 protein [Bizionia myxarmorum]|uniref:Glycosyltransferase family 4 protein n=1 Tax=Bizionia myxarmorum TaxID=291186 RepID=A0A5D0R8J7_9FLAO|nr:glycosyltransferase family 4 protein [Bizionia myxarmorum]TYB77008.1 glycosyltransferase family 4 protein [Bizionia myxarmorum]